MRLNLRRLVCQCALALALAVVLVTSAAAQRGNIVSITFYTVKPDRVGDFQAEIKEYNALYAKAGATNYNSVWASLTGPREYARVMYYNKWADLDAGPDPKLKDQEADLARIGARIIDCTEGWRRTIEEVQPDLSLPPSNDIPKLIRVLVTQVRPDKYKEYLNLVKTEILPAAKKGELKMYQFAETRYGGSNTQVSSVVAMDGWGDLDGEVGIQKGLGKEGYQALLDKVRPLIVQAEVNEYRFQPDLSYLPPATAK
jgi:hypothetical protein